MSDQPQRDEQDQVVAVQVHDVIQIAPDERVKAWFHGKFALVDEVRSWGVCCHVDLLEGQAYNRLVWGTFEVIGKAAFLPVKPEDEENHAE